MDIRETTGNRDQTRLGRGRTGGIEASISRVFRRTGRSGPTIVTVGAEIRDVEGLQFGAQRIGTAKAKARKKGRQAARATTRATRATSKARDRRKEET